MQLLTFSLLLTLLFTSSYTNSLSQYPRTIEDAEKKMLGYCQHWSPINNPTQFQTLAQAAVSLAHEHYSALHGVLSWGVVRETKYINRCGAKRLVVVRFSPGALDTNGHIHTPHGNDECMVALGFKSEGSGLKIELRDVDCYYQGEHYFRGRYD